MASIYVSEETKKKLYQFINRTRYSPIFGSPKKYPNPNKAIEFLLEIALKYPLETLEELKNQVLIEGSITMTDEEYEQFEKEDKLKEIVEKELEPKIGSPTLAKMREKNEEVEDVS